MKDYLDEILELGEDALKRALQSAEAALAFQGQEAAETEKEAPSREEKFQETPRADHRQEDRENLPVQAGESAGETSSAGLDGAGRPLAERSALSRALQSRQSQEAVSAAPDTQARENAGRSPAEPADLPLAGALKQADRSTAQAASLAGREPTSVSLERLAAEQGGGTAPGRTRANRTGAGGELETVQQVDRAFRRDSRRYDGGFFLY